MCLFDTSLSSCILLVFCSSLFSSTHSSCVLSLSLSSRSPGALLFPSFSCSSCAFTFSRSPFPLHAPLRACLLLGSSPLSSSSSSRCPSSSSAQSAHVMRWSSVHSTILHCAILSTAATSLPFAVLVCAASLLLPRLPWSGGVSNRPPC